MHEHPGCCPETAGQLAMVSKRSQRPTRQGSCRGGLGTQSTELALPKTRRGGIRTQGPKGKNSAATTRSLEARRLDLPLGNRVTEDKLSSPCISVPLFC